MSAKANSATDDEPAHGVTIAAKAYDANTPEQMLHGTEHILVDGEPLCGNHHVKKHVESGRYGTETTRHPLNGHDTCKSCGQIYVSRYGSKHETFEQLADFEKGDWVSITTEDGETMTGRVSHTADRTDFPSRRITIVLSDEPQKRWIYGVEQEIKVRVSEGEQPVIAHGSILDDGYSEEPVAEIDTTTAPVDNVDERTAATLDDLEEIAGSRAKTVMTLGGDRHLFHINARESLTTQELWELLDEFYKAGYEIKGVTPGEERSGTDCAAISLIAKPLKSPLATDGGESMPDAREMTVVEMYDSGMAWPDIAEALGTDVDEAMQQYRDQAYDHWDTGWERDAEDGQARVTTGAIDLWTDGDATVHIEEVSNDIPLTIVVEDDETRTLTDAGLTAEQARDLAAALDECADILEEKR